MEFNCPSSFFLGRENEFKAPRNFIKKYFFFILKRLEARRDHNIVA